MSKDAHTSPNSSSTPFSKAWRFTLLSGFSFILNVGISTCGHELFGMPEEISYFLSLITVFFSSFIACRYFVYQGSPGPLLKELAGFARATIGFRLLEYISFLILHSIMRLNYIACIIGISAIFTILKFLFLDKFVFKRLSPDDQKSSSETTRL